MTVSDGTLSSSEAPLEVTFGAQNDAPTDDDATTVIAGFATITAATGVNDVDVDSPISVESAVLITPQHCSPITDRASITGQYGRSRLR